MYINVNIVVCALWCIVFVKDVCIYAFYSVIISHREGRSR